MPSDSTHFDITPRAHIRAVPCASEGSQGGKTNPGTDGEARTRIPRSWGGTFRKGCLKRGQATMGTLEPRLQWRSLFTSQWSRTAGGGAVPWRGLRRRGPEIGGDGARGALRVVHQVVHHPPARRQLRDERTQIRDLRRRYTNHARVSYSGGLQNKPNPKPDTKNPNTPQRHRSKMNTMPINVRPKAPSGGMGTRASSGCGIRSHRRPPPRQYLGLRCTG